MIADFDLYRYDLAFAEPVTLKGATLNRREGTLIRLIANDGSEGWGEAAPLPGFSPESLDDATEQLRTIASSLVNRELPENVLIPDENSFPELSRLAASARFGLELALLNLAATSRGLTLPEGLSDLPERTISTNGLLSGSMEKVLADARSMKNDGYRAVKLKVGRRKVSEDVEVVRRVGEILGDGVSLRLDANRAWKFDGALGFARGISGVRVAYVEEPLAEPGRLPELAREWSLPVALDESLVGMGPEGLERHPYARAVVLKPTLLGGISRALRLAERAEALGMASVVSSSYEGGVGTGALVALAAAVGVEPAGLDTYRALAEDVIEVPLQLPAPTMDVREAMEAARKVDVARLEPIPLL
ncbi:MAG: O-succinylbenzoate synthase [uncultured Rubrobacteraceae bacterium]|uniref:o-succinylbenzoate synthase n=1 Tax=uncultured Rubrobacteraceae bacterium TaxID=349277 RepID=A0A6J4PQK6_9ACTN|nr:MAG: O-succinylbenzoate synthase [uncultured Rubrobacteraceae bacterium]